MNRWKHACLALLLALMVATPVGTALAQEGTPEPLTNVAGAAPAIGDEVAYISESGGEIAALRVTDVLRPWTEYDEFSEPEGGTEYIAVVVEVTHLGRRGDLVVRPFDFRIQDQDGFLITEAWAEGAPGAEVMPTDDEVVIASGDTETVVIVFQVIEDIGLANLFWMPEYDRLITLADLTSI